MAGAPPVHLEAVAGVAGRGGVPELFEVLGQGSCARLPRYHPAMVPDENRTGLSVIRLRFPLAALAFAAVFVALFAACEPSRLTEPTATPVDIGATVQAAIAEVLPSQSPSPTLDITPTGGAVVRLLSRLALGSEPTPTPTPLPMPTPTPLPVPTPTPTPASTPSPTPIPPTLPPTPTATPQPVPTLTSTAEPGNLLWRYQTGDEVRSSPAVAGSVVYVGSNDRNVRPGCGHR